MLQAVIETGSLLFFSCARFLQLLDIFHFIKIMAQCNNYSTKIFPVISLGMGSCIIDKIVGAMSPNLPLFNLPFHSLSIIKNGTRFKECAVLGVPSALIS